MPDSNTLVKINEQMYKSEKTSRDLRGYSLGGKKNHKGTTFRTVFQSSYSDVGIFSTRSFRQLEMGINGDIGQDLSLCLPQIIMPQIIMKHKGQLDNMFDIYQLMNSKMRHELSQGEACLIF